MNAVLSLCHFCEAHGPRVVFTTQVFRDLPQNHLQPELQRDVLPSYKIVDNIWKYGAIKKDFPFHDQYPSMMDICAACQSLEHTKDIIVSNNDDNQLSFVSSQYPFQEEIFSRLRQASIRSLSCEVYTERDDPIYFGDSSRGHVLSFTFNLKDFQARGFQRRYGILVLMADKMFLLNSWAFFREYLRDCIGQLQEMARKVFKEEEKLNIQIKSLNPSLNCEKDKRRRAAGNPRALKDLIGAEEIWINLHQKFSWILSAGGIRLQEKMVEGRPLYIADVESSPISLVGLMEMMTSENFVKFLHHMYIGNTISIVSESEEILHNISLTLKPILFNFLHVSAVGYGNEVLNDTSIFLFHSASDLDKFNTDVSFIFRRLMMDDHNQSSKNSLTVEIVERKSLVGRAPQIVSKIVSHLHLKESEFSSSLLHLYLATLIDEWTNKIKLWSSLKDPLANRTVGYTENLKESRSFSLSAPSCTQTGISKRKSSILPLLTTTAHPSSLSDNSALLNIVGALECDIPMLNAMALLFKKMEN